MRRSRLKIATQVSLAVLVPLVVCWALAEPDHEWRPVGWHRIGLRLSTDGISLVWTDRSASVYLSDFLGRPAGAYDEWGSPRFVPLAEVGDSTYWWNRSEQVDDSNGWGLIYQRSPLRSHHQDDIVRYDVESALGLAWPLLLIPPAILPAAWAYVASIYLAAWLIRTTTAGTRRWQGRREQRSAASP